MSHNQNSRRALAALLGISVSLGLAACAVPDGPVTPGERPNRPTASAATMTARC